MPIRVGAKSDTFRSKCRYVSAYVPIRVGAVQAEVFVLSGRAGLLIKHCWRFLLIERVCFVAMAG
jgi:hypothetical protein